MRIERYEIGLDRDDDGDGDDGRKEKEVYMVHAEIRVDSMEEGVGLLVRLKQTQAEFAAAAEEG